MNDRKWMEAELQQISGLGLPSAANSYEINYYITEIVEKDELSPEALEKIREHESNKSIFHPGINVFDTADRALQSIKESPREEQTK